eukprot:GHVU01103097.1.p1 GENE.GHVU01103097.1~~GHVU01103097.1.p1  ORF type:complete len:192 (-),score=12.76 GHVU01103097.1:856-1431(-)
MRSTFITRVAVSATLVNFSIVQAKCRSFNFSVVIFSSPPHVFGLQTDRQSKALSLCFSLSPLLWPKDGHAQRETAPPHHSGSLLPSPARLPPRLRATFLDGCLRGGDVRVQYLSEPVAYALQRRVSGGYLEERPTTFCWMLLICSVKVSSSTLAPATGAAAKRRRIRVRVSRSLLGGPGSGQVMGGLQREL